MIVPVVVQIDDSVELSVHVDLKFIRIIDALTQGLARIFLHLDVVELPARKKRKKKMFNNIFTFVFTLDRLCHFRRCQIVLSRQRSYLDKRFVLSKSPHLS